MKFVDLHAQYEQYRDEIDKSIQAVIDSTSFINGSEVQAMEDDLASFCGVEHVLACSSGTDALLIALKVLGVGAGDEVLVPDFSYIASASMISFAGGTPVFVDVEPDTCNIDVGTIEQAINEHTRGIVAVSLFGQCPDLDGLRAIAKKHGLWLLEDGAQSFGATYKHNRSCSITEVSTTSFFPAKPLGCYGDGGAIFTNDTKLAETMRMFLNHGQEKRYHHAMIGINGRMDTIQAAVVRVKLRHFQKELEMRERIAQRYSQNLDGYVQVPVIRDYNTSSWAQYTIQSPKREKIREHLHSRGIPTAVHYPLPLHRQKAFGLDDTALSYPVSEGLSQRVVSLPMHPFLCEDEIDTICEAVKEAVDG
jgi:UDP-2-acetamido-2-deoxy-ribo-hexuluronate aminotransferase